MPTHSLLRPLLKNSILMALSSAVGALVIIVSVPIVVDRLGPEGYGVWECMLAVSSAAMVFQAAINGTLIWRISMTCGVHDADASRRLVRLGIGSTLALVGLFVPAVWLGRYAIITALQVPESWAADTEWLLPQIVFLMLIGGVNQAVLALVAGYQRAGLAALIQCLGLVATHTTAIGVLLAGGGLNALLWGMAAGFTATLLVSYLTAARLCGRISLIPLWPSLDDFRVLAPFAGLLLLSNLTLVLRDNTDKLILAAEGSPAMTGYFAMSQRLSSLVMQVGWTVCLPLTAAVGSLYAVQNWAAIRRLYEQVNLWLVVASGLVGFLICTLRAPLFVLWLGADQPQAHGYLALLLFGVAAALTFTGAGVALAKGIGRPGLETAYMVVTLVLILVTKPLFVSAFGALGSVASSSASWCLGAAYFGIMLQRRLELPRLVLIRSASIFALSVAMSAVAWLITMRHPLPVAGRWEAAIVLVAMTVPLAACHLGLLFVCRLIPAPTHVIAALRSPHAVVEANG